jgi:isopentenyl-diphosphate delta-isomerase type 1
MSLLRTLASVWWKVRYVPDELIVLANEDGTPAGIAPKLKAHNADTKLHLAFSVFIFDQAGRLLLQRRALGKKTWPGVWSNSCCGHVMLRESTEDAAARRLKKELGIVADELTIVLPDFRYRAEKDGIVENEICPVLVGMCDSEVVPDAKEVAEYRWIDWVEFLDWIEKPDSEFSPWAVEEVQLLAESPIFKTWFRKNILASKAA